MTAHSSCRRSPSDRRRVCPMPQPAGAVPARVLPFAEEDARQVVLGFTLGKKPARDAQFLAFALKAPSGNAFIVARTLAITVADCNQTWTLRYPLHPALDLVRHLSHAAHAVEPDWLSGFAPVSIKRLVELPHDALQERAVAVPILDENDHRFFSEPGRVIGAELICPDWVHRYAHAPAVQRRSPRTALNRCDKHVVYTFALTSGVTKPARGLEHFGVRFAVRIPDVPSILDLEQNAIQPPMSVRMIRDADINLDVHRPQSVDRFARRMARISS